MSDSPQAESDYLISTRDLLQDYLRGNLNYDQFILGASLCDDNNSEALDTLLADMSYLAWPQQQKDFALANLYHSITIRENMSEI